MYVVNLILYNDFYDVFIYKCNFALLLLFPVAFVILVIRNYYFALIIILVFYFNFWLVSLGASYDHSHTLISNYIYDVWSLLC